jgi:hypothetical protein
MDMELCNGLSYRETSRIGVCSTPRSDHNTSLASNND